MSLSDPRPSLWSVRHHRRHAAVSRDVVAITKKVTGLELQVSSVGMKLDLVLTKLDKLVAMQPPGMKQGSDTEMFIKEKLQSNASRIDRLELLLFRTSMRDFATLDAKIEESLPKISPIQRRGKIVDQLPHHTSAIDDATQPSAPVLPFVPVFPYESKHYGIYEQSEKNVVDDKRDEKQVETKDENQDEFQGDDEKKHESQVDDEKQDDCQDDDEKLDERQVDGEKQDENQDNLPFEVLKPVESDTKAEESNKVKQDGKNDDSQAENDENKEEAETYDFDRKIGKGDAHTMEENGSKDGDNGSLRPDEGLSTDNQLMLEAWRSLIEDRLGVG